VNCFDGAVILEKDNGEDVSEFFTKCCYF